MISEYRVLFASMYSNTSKRFALLSRYKNHHQTYMFYFIHCFVYRKIPELYLKDKV